MRTSHACRRKNPMDRDIALLLQIASYSIRARLAQGLVPVGFPSGICESGNLDQVSLSAQVPSAPRYPTPSLLRRSGLRY